MPTERVDGLLIRGLLLGITVVVALIVGAMLPRVLIPEVQGDWTGSDAAAARYAAVRVGNAGGFLQHALRTQIGVVNIDPDPSGCDWGYQQPISARATVKTYTLFGIPLETWRVDCRSESLSSSLLLRFDPFVGLVVLVGLLAGARAIVRYRRPRSTVSAPPL